MSNSKPQAEPRRLPPNCRRRLTKPPSKAHKNCSRSGSRDGLCPQKSPIHCQGQRCGRVVANDALVQASVDRWITPDTSTLVEGNSDESFAAVCPNQTAAGEYSPPIHWHARHHTNLLVICCRGCASRGCPTSRMPPCSMSASCEHNREG